MGKNFDKLVVGGFYNNSGGAVIGPLEYSVTSKDYPYFHRTGDGCRRYTPAGNYIDGVETQKDLIERVNEDGSPFVDDLYPLKTGEFYYCETNACGKVIGECTDSGDFNVDIAVALEGGSERYFVTSNSPIGAAKRFATQEEIAEYKRKNPRYAEKKEPAVEQPVLEQPPQDPLSMVRHKLYELNEELNALSNDYQWEAKQGAESVDGVSRGEIAISISHKIEL